MTLHTYTDEEVRRLETIGRRRTVESLLDIKQLHLTDFQAGD
jgi:hypothetical protein